MSLAHAHVCDWSSQIMGLIMQRAFYKLLRTSPFGEMFGSYLNGTIDILWSGTTEKELA